MDDYPYSDVRYTGAPDECDIHWPTKLSDDGTCPECVAEQEAAVKQLLR